MSLLYKDIKNSPSALLSLTGLTEPEFESLLPLFVKAEEDYVREIYTEGKERKRAPGAGRGPKLRTAEDRLFFILFYLKTYPLQQVAAVLFGMSLSQTNIWIHRLSEVLKRALGGGSYLPERDPAASEKALKKCPALFLSLTAPKEEYSVPTTLKYRKYITAAKKRDIQ
jgi:hypothetical protein